MKRSASIWTAIALGAALNVSCSLPTSMALWMIEQGASARMGADMIADLPDGLHVGLCGAGSPLPDPDRSGPCVAVIAGEDLYIVDSGSGSSRVLAQMGIPQAAVDAVLLTHFHSDHIDGLGELMMQRWAGGGHTEPTPVYGPTGVERVVAGFNEAYSHDFGFRVAHHGDDTVPRSGAGGRAMPVEIPPAGESATVLENGDLKITMFQVDHAPVEPAVGYRFDYKGRSVAISGDTAKSANLEKFAQGVDLLAHEALSKRMVGVMNKVAQDNGNTRLAKITADIMDYHTSPVEAAETAQAAGARHLLFYHIVPPLVISAMEGVFLDGVSDAFDGDTTLGTDGTFISMPAGSTDISADELL